MGQSFNSAPLLNLKNSQLGNNQYYSHSSPSEYISSVIIRIFCDVLVLLFQVLCVGTKCWTKMTTITHRPMPQLTFTWKRSRRKELERNKSNSNPDARNISPCGGNRRNRYFTFFSQLTFYLLIFYNFHPLNCAPIARPAVTVNSVFGYLPQSGFEIRNQVSEDRMRDAIREIQSFANLTVTGEIDSATLKLIRTPRCGVPDILTGQFNSRTRYRRYIVQGQKWSNTNLTWSLKRPTPTHDERDIIEELARAFNVWSKSTILRFTRLSQEQADDADIRIVFSKGYHDDGYPFDGKGSILAHAFFPGTGQGGDAHFDDDEVWVIGGKSPHEEAGTRLFAVAAHEFGHSLGLSHSDVEGSLMYPWYQNFDYDLKLSQDDELGIQRIYGSGSRWSPNPYNPKSGGSGGGGGGRRTNNDIPVSRPPVTTRRPYRGKNYYPDGRPSTCDSSYDAISLIRDELFIFRGRYFWRISSTPNTNDNRLLKGYPSLITIMWQRLPANISHVDAVYEHNKEEIVFFIAGTRLFAVAAHEFGHSLGLSHSDVEGSLMYPWYQNFDYDLKLSQDDELGIQRIYGSGSRWSPNPYNPKSGGSGGGGGGRRTNNDIPVSRPPVTTRRPYRGKNYYPDGRPSTCDSSYDAISLIRDELFIFRGRYFWRINSTPNTNDNRLLKGYPSLITIMWQRLPANISHVDAVYEHNKEEIVFFIGRQYWRFRGTELIPGYPQPLTSMGISPEVEKIDGAMIWGYNKRTYLFSGTKYWRLQDDPQYFHVEPDYPRDMHIWEGVPYNIDSVLKWKDGNVYFFKGKVFWKFNDKHMRVDSRTPTLSAPFWMGCTSTPLIPTESTTPKPPLAGGSTSSFSSLSMTLFVVIAYYALPKTLMVTMN